MNKFSVIVPTMWRCKHVFIPFLHQLSQNNKIAEIIIINNDKEKTPWDDLPNSLKLKMLDYGKNIGCNPAWNIGVEFSQNSFLCIINDDISFDLKVLDILENQLSPDKGLFGLCPGEPDFSQPPITDGSIEIIPWTGQHTYGFGCLFFLHRDSWSPIPNGLILYYGDNYIFDLQLMQGKTNYLITNMKFGGQFAATTSDTNLSGGVLDRETQIYERIKISMNGHETLRREYESAKNNYSDIYYHVPVLYDLAKNCKSVVELGVRTGISTRAFLHADCRVRSYDIEIDPNVVNLFQIAKSLNKDVEYIQGSSLEIDIEPCDMMFVDTVHSYEQVSAELARHASKVRKYIAFHDTYIFGLGNENILGAVIEFMRDNPEWQFNYWTKENNGLTVIERKSNQELTLSKIPATLPKKRILIAVPTNRFVETETMKSIYDLDLPSNVDTEIQFFYGYQIDQIRNLIAEWGRRYDYLFCVDSDIVLPADTLKRFINADRDVISGLYIQRKPGEHILEIYKDNGHGGVSNIPYERLKNRGIVEVASCGFGCVLVKSEVLRRMEYPHFQYHSALDHANTISEDIYFCLKARSLGFKIWADTDLHCEHIGQTKFLVESPVAHNPVNNPNDFKNQVLNEFQRVSDALCIPSDHQFYVRELATKHKIIPKVIYDIGSCVLHWTKFASSVWPNAKIYQFEAMDMANEFYEKHGLTDYSNILLTNQDNREVVFYQNLLLPGGNSYYRENTEAFTDNHAVKKIGMTLDTVVAQRGWPLPDMIKLDTQGSEIDILKGATKCLENCYDIILEAQHKDYNIGAPKAQEVIAFMDSIGYKLISNFAHAGVDSDFHFKKYR